MSEAAGVRLPPTDQGRSKERAKREERRGRDGGWVMRRRREREREGWT